MARPWGMPFSNISRAIRTMRKSGPILGASSLAKISQCRPGRTDPTPRAVGDVTSRGMANQERPKVFEEIAWLNGDRIVLGWSTPKFCNLLKLSTDGASACSQILGDSLDFLKDWQTRARPRRRLLLKFLPISRRLGLRETLSLSPNGSMLGSRLTIRPIFRWFNVRLCFQAS